MTKLVWDVPTDRSHDGATVADVHGDLDHADRSALVADLARLLAERHRVVLGVSDLRLHADVHPDCLTEALEQAGGWPQVRFVLASPSAALAELLTSSEVAHEIPAFPSVPEALTHLDDRPPLVRACWRFTVDPYAPGRARANIRDVGARWTLDEETREAAEIVITELVTNAVEHASSRSFVEVSWRREALRVAVRDYAVDESMPAVGTWVAPPTSSPRGRGLAMVAAVSRTWGMDRHPDGKTVWAEMALT